MLPVVWRQFFWTFRLHAVLREHFLWNVVNQKRVGNVIDRRKMLPQPSILLRISIYPDERINRHDNPTCLRLARIYDRAGMTTEIFSQVPLVSAPVQVRICQTAISQFSVEHKFVKIRYEMRIV